MRRFKTEKVGNSELSIRRLAFYMVGYIFKMNKYYIFLIYHPGCVIQELDIGF